MRNKVKIDNNIWTLIHNSIYLNSGKCFSRALIGYSNSGHPVLFADSPPAPRSERRNTRRAKWLPGLLP